MPPDTFVSPCIACGSSDFQHLLTPEQVEEERDWLKEFHLRRTTDPCALKDRAEFTQSQPTYIDRCSSCGTVFRNPQPEPHELDRQYRFDEYGEETLQRLLESERSFFRAKAAAIDLPPGARVLEVGSFVGAFLLAAKERGWDAAGVDVGKEACAFTRSLGLDVQEGTVDTATLKGPYDAIFIWNTFDQVNRPEMLLGRLAELSRPGTRLVIRIPNGAFESAAVDARSGRHAKGAVLAQAYNNFLTFPYLCGYSPDAIACMLARNGFNVDGIVGDVILPLSNADTKPCAVEEELYYKRGVLRYCRQRLERHGEMLYPWMDIYSQV